MSVAIETAELISALQSASKEAMDVIEATEDATDGDLAALGHNGVRDAAKDAHNICNNLIRRLGGLAIEPKKPEPVEQPVPEPEPEPEITASEAMLDELEATKTNLDRAIEEAQAAPEQPPEAIADLFQADKPLAPQAQALHQLWVKLGHQVQRGEANADEIRKHERLSSEIEFINKHAFDGV